MIGWPDDRPLIAASSEPAVGSFRSADHHARHAELLQRLVRAAVPAHRTVAHVLQILDAHLRRPEAGGGEIAEAVEEGDAVRVPARIRPGRSRRARPRDVVEHRRSLSVGAVDERLSNRSSHSTSSHASPPRIATWRAGWSIIMKSMNSGTPASVALPDRSSFGMMRSTSTRTVCYWCAVKNFGVNAVRRRRLRRLRQLARSRFGLGPREHRGDRRRDQRAQHASTIDVSHSCFSAQLAAISSRPTVYGLRSTGRRSTAHRTPHNARRTRHRALSTQHRTKNEARRTARGTRKRGTRNEVSQPSRLSSARRCAPPSASPAPGSSTSGSCPASTRTARRRRRTGSSRRAPGRYLFSAD